MLFDPIGHNILRCQPQNLRNSSITYYIFISFFLTVHLGQIINKNNPPAIVSWNVSIYNLSRQLHFVVNKLIKFDTMYPILGQGPPS